MIFATAAENPLVVHFLSPWLVMIGSAVLFGWVALRHGRSKVGWAVAGGTLGLVLTAIARGLAAGVTLPYTDEQQAAYAMRGIAVAVALIVITAGICLWALGRGENRAAPAKP